MLNATPLNQQSLNSQRPVTGIFLDDEERSEIYLLEVGGQRIPMSSFQATMRRSGASFLQAVVPSVDDHLGLLTVGETMKVKLGYFYPASGLIGNLETIAEAPLEQLRTDQGPTRYTGTLSGYGYYQSITSSQRPLRGVQTRSVNDGLRRVRAEVDLLLRPGHYAIDTDGKVFRIKDIQYFVNATSAAMEVTELYTAQPISITFETAEWTQYLEGDWVKSSVGDFIESADITDDQTSKTVLTVPFDANIAVSYKVSSEEAYDFFYIKLNGQNVVSDSGNKTASWIAVSFGAGPSDLVEFIYQKDSSVSENDDKAYVNKIDIVPA